MTFYLQKQKAVIWQVFFYRIGLDADIICYIVPFLNAMTVFLKNDHRKK